MIVATALIAVVVSCLLVYRESASLEFQNYHLARVQRIPRVVSGVCIHKLPLRVGDRICFRLFAKNTMRLTLAQRSGGVSDVISVPVKQGRSIFWIEFDKSQIAISNSEITESTINLVEDQLLSLKTPGDSTFLIMEAGDGQEASMQLKLENP